MYNCFVAEKKPSFYAKKLLILPTQEVDCFWSLDSTTTTYLEQILYYTGEEKVLDK